VLPCSLRLLSRRVDHGACRTKPGYPSASFATHAFMFSRVGW
jgi:hypothetical protein